ncbi:MAG: hypothetical protein V4582_16825 [Pseudomonadota bacterium]
MNTCNNVLATGKALPSYSLNLSRCCLAFRHEKIALASAAGQKKKMVGVKPGNWTIQKMVGVKPGNWTIQTSAFKLSTCQV